MDRIDTEYKAEDLFGAGKHGFIDGDLPNAIIATRLNAKWFNAAQEELLQIIEGAGIAPDGAVFTQVRRAIKRLAGSNITTVNFANSPFVLTADHAGLVIMDATAGNISATLSAANALAASPLKFHFVRFDATGNTATITRAGADTFVGGALSFTLTGQGDYRSIESDTASKWSTTSAPQRLFPPQRRQAVNSAVVDANGFPVFMTTAASLNLPILATAVPIRLSAAGGYDANGPVDRPGSITADTTIAIANNTTNFIFGDTDANGVVTLGSGTFAPVVQKAGVPSVTAGQYTFNWGEMKGYLGNGATAPQVYRTYLGEAVTSGGVITSVVNYALNRTCVLADTAVPATATATNYLTRMGFTSGLEARADLVSLGTDLGYAVGDIVQNVTTQFWTGVYLIAAPPVSINDRNFARFVMSTASIYIPTATGGGLGVVAGITPASWNLRLSVTPIW